MFELNLIVVELSNVESFFAFRVSVNQDRHHYETFTVYDHSVYFLHLDNGRA